MGILAWILLGLVAGLIAKFLIPGNDPGGIIVTTLVGIAGAVLGGFAGTRLGWGDVKGFDLRSIALSVGGAILLLLLLRLIFR